MNLTDNEHRPARVLRLPLWGGLVLVLLALGLYLQGRRPNSLTSASNTPAGTLVSIEGETEIVLGDSFPPKSTVFFFLRADCPIGNRYAPEIAQIATDFGAEGSRTAGFDFHCVYPDDLPEKIELHQQEFRLGINAYHDPQHILVGLLGITRAPEAVVIDGTGRQVYRGRINDQFVDFGKARRAATTHDLRTVLSALAQGEPVTPTVTQAVGCYIE